MYTPKKKKGVDTTKVNFNFFFHIDRMGKRKMSVIMKYRVKKKKFNIVKEEPDTELDIFFYISLSPQFAANNKNTSTQHQVTNAPKPIGEKKKKKGNGGSCSLCSGGGGVGRARRWFCFSHLSVSPCKSSRSIQLASLTPRLRLFNLFLYEK